MKIAGFAEIININMGPITITRIYSVMDFAEAAYKVKFLKIKIKIKIKNPFGFFLCIKYSPENDINETIFI